MGLLPVSTLTPGHFGTVTGSPASLHANVKSKAVSSPVRSSACTRKATLMHHTIPSLGSFRADVPSGLQQQSTLVLAEHGGLAARFWTKAETTEPCLGSPVPPGRGFFFWLFALGYRLTHR